MKRRKSPAVIVALGGVAAAGAGADPANAMLPAPDGGGTPPSTSQDARPAQGGHPTQGQPQQQPPPPPVNPTPPPQQPQQVSPPPKATPAPNKPKLRRDAHGYADTLDHVEADGGALRMGTATALQRYGKDPAVVERAQAIMQRRREAREQQRRQEEERQANLDDNGIERVDDPGRYKLQPEGFDRQARQNLREMQRNYPRVSLDEVVRDGNHPTGDLHDEDRGIREILDDDPTEHVPDAEGYSWEDSDDFSDNDVERMTPQGITGQDGIHAVSWYGQPGGDGPDSSARITLVNRQDHEYRHVLLVDPTPGGGFDQVQTHTGGIAWKGDHMYVADTHGGFDVFDTSEMMRVPEGGDQDPTDGYRYLLPKVGSYRSTGSELLFSTASIDESDPRKPALVVGEYRNDDDPDTRGNSHVVRWSVDPDTGLLTQEKASDAYETQQDQIQGVAMHNGRFYLSSSDPGGSGGALYTGAAGGRLEQGDWGDSPESLYVEGDRLWSLSEHAHDRVVYNVPLDQR